MASASIEVHVHDLRQLFDSMDPSPFREKDLDRNAEEWIILSAKELPGRTASELVVHLDRRAHTSDDGRDLEGAIRDHFSRKARMARLEARDLLRRGWISFAIGMTFLALALLAGEMVHVEIGDNHLGDVLRESMHIGGWVAMWKPIQIFLYEWWPILGERRSYDRLSRIRVRIVYTRPELRQVSVSRT